MKPPRVSLLCLSFCLLLVTTFRAQAELRIHDLQGAAHLSPLRGQYVIGVVGVATLTGPGGFFLQEQRPDDDRASSEGIFVYAPHLSSPDSGCEVAVDGEVAEFRSRREGLSVTELRADDLRQVRCGVPLPAPARILALAGTALLGIDDDLAGSAEAVPPARFEPEEDAIDFFESLEGMRVELERARVVEGPDRFGNWWVQGVDDGGSPLQVARFRVVPMAGEVSTTPRRGDLSRSPLRGALHYGASAWELVVDEAPSFESPRSRNEERSRFRGTSALTIATWNLRNLAGNDPGEAFRTRALRIVDALGSPDVVVLQEVQDADGSGTSVGARGAPTLERLIDAITRAGGPRYHYLQIDPDDGADGGAPNTNIRVAILYEPQRVEHRAPEVPARAAASLRCRGGRALLAHSPSRISPASTAFLGSRKPLVASLYFRGVEFKLVALHLTSRRGDDPLFGWAQPPRRPSTARRVGQAEAVSLFLQEILACDPDARVIVAGDLNAGPDSPTSRVLEDAGLVHLGRKLPAADRYSFIFRGGATLLDAILLSPALTRVATRLQALHLDTRLPFHERVSDHDALVARVRFD